MIKKCTVLILGAGASAPFGYPTGAKLYNDVCSELAGGIVEKVLAEHHFDLSKITEFREALYKSGVTSVDAFLETRPEYIEMGKIAITVILVKFEMENELFSDGPGKWYKYLLSRLGNKIEDLPRNNLSIITYNYDRSLEQFLFTAIKNKYALKEEDAAKILKVIPIIHLHGKLAGLPWESGFTRPYNAAFPRRSDIQKTAELIRIVHENVTNDTDFETARQLITDADNVFCLGFGYGQTNLDRLRVTLLPHNKITGTTVGFTPAELTHIMSSNNNVLNLPHTPLDALDFLRNKNWE